MELKLRRISGLEATRLSRILKNYSCEALLKTGKYCVDGKSVLGILSAMGYSQGEIILEINELDDSLQGELAQKLIKFIHE